MYVVREIQTCTSHIRLYIGNSKKRYISGTSFKLKTIVHSLQRLSQPVRSKLIPFRCRFDHRVQKVADNIAPRAVLQMVSCLMQLKPKWIFVSVIWSLNFGEKLKTHFERSTEAYIIYIIVYILPHIVVVWAWLHANQAQVSVTKGKRHSEDVLPPLSDVFLPLTCFIKQRSNQKGMKDRKMATAAVWCVTWREVWAHWK